MAELDGHLVIEWVPTGDLKPNPANPRRHGEAVQKVADSIQHFGWRQPIVVSKQDNMIEAGHARWEAAKQLGLEEVPVVFFDDDAVTAAAFNIADNRARDFSEWDNEALASLLVSLQSEDALLETGFTDADLDELLGSIVEPVEETFDVAEALESEIEPRIQRGEVWQLGRHRLMCGDSTTAEDVAKLMGGEKVNLVLTDPPYGIGVEYGAFEDSANNVRALIAEIMPVLLRFPVVLITPGITEMWSYPPPKWLLGWVHPAGNGNCPWGFTSLHPILAYGDDPYLKRGLGGRPTAIVLAEGRPAIKGHPTPKPIGVWEWLLERGSVDRGDVVFDPFLGSGTTTIAAERLGRTAYGIEIEPPYCEVAIQRWEDYTDQQAVKIG